MSAATEHSTRMTAYCERLRRMTNERLAQEAGMRILGAAVVARMRCNDGWEDDQAGACLDEARARGNSDLYQRGFNSAVRSQGYRDMAREITTPLEHGEPPDATEKPL